MPEHEKKRGSSAVGEKLSAVCEGKAACQQQFVPAACRQEPTEDAALVVSTVGEERAEEPMEG
eukprot:401070-Lingulodinium_polyedra.AAC.1